MQIHINWLLQKPTDLDLHCLQGSVYPDSVGQGLNECNFPTLSPTFCCCTFKCVISDAVTFRVFVLVAMMCCVPLLRSFSGISIVVVRIFNSARYPRHVEATAIVMYMYLYYFAFMDHPCTLGAALSCVCHQASSCPLYTQPRARRVWARRINGLKSVLIWAGFEPTISRLKLEAENH